MADNIDQIKAELEALKKEQAAAAAAAKAQEAELEEAKRIASEREAEVNALREKVGPNDNTGKPIEGTFKVALETPDGKKVNKTFKFKPGYINCRLSDGEKVPSELLMKVANGKKLTEAELKANPRLVSLTQDAAGEWLSKLARIGASFLVEA